MAASDDDVPIGQRVVPQRAAARTANAASAATVPKASAATVPKKRKKLPAQDENEEEDDEPKQKRTAKEAGSKAKEAGAKAKKAGSKSKDELWETLQHQGVLFPPAYVPHGIPLLYDGQPVALSPAEEEVLSLTCP